MDLLAFEDSFRIRAYMFRPINSCHNTLASTMRRAFDRLMVVGGLEDRYAYERKHHRGRTRKKTNGWKNLDFFDPQQKNLYFVKFHSSSTNYIVFFLSWCDKSFSHFSFENHILNWKFVQRKRICISGKRSWTPSLSLNFFQISIFPILDMTKFFVWWR